MIVERERETEEREDAVLPLLAQLCLMKWVLDGLSLFIPIFFPPSLDVNSLYFNLFVSKFINMKKPVEVRCLDGDIILN